MTDFKILESYVEKKVCVLIGTRPGIIKMSPLIKELKRRKADYFVAHAGQHYSYNMDNKIRKDLGLAKPKYKLEETKRYILHGEQTAEMLKGIEKILIIEKPEFILVCGDANFNLAGALAARKLRLKVGHVESGLRSNDWRMPEEHNRIMIDHISDFLFAPTEIAKQNALADNVKGQVFVTGNTIVDAVFDIKNKIGQANRLLTKLGVEDGKYFLLTLHREENVDIRNIISSILDGIQAVSDRYNIPIIYPIHPRTQKRIIQFGLVEKAKQIKHLHLIDPLGYLDFILLLSRSRCVLTDSGGVQEESCILKVPCITLRESTERPETISIGSNILVGIYPERITNGMDIMLAKQNNWVNPFGDGMAARKIISIILD